MDTTDVVAGAAVEDRARRALRASGTVLRVGDERVVHRQGDPGVGVCLVVEGRVHLSAALGDGHELTLSDVGPGGVFGLVSAIDGGPHTATATTVGGCRLVVVGLGALHELMAHDAAVATFLARELARHLRQADARLAQHCSQTTLERVVGRLRSLEPLAEAGRIRTTQREIADWVGSSREATARALSHLRDEGAIETGRGWVRIVDDALLETTVA